MQGGIELSEVIDQLRLELQVLRNRLRDDPQDLQFKLDGVEVELHVAVTKEASAEAKARFWVVEIGGGGKVASTATQVIRLKLTPLVQGEAGAAPTETLIGR